MARRKQRIIATNKNSHIVNRVDRTGKVRTETTRRDGGELDVAISTNARSGSTRLFLDAEGREGNFGGFATMTLNGRQARTLFIALQRHFDQTGVPSVY
jgi:hypothetical protein